MADRVYPSAKPAPPPAAAANGNGNGGAAAGSFPAPKTQMYQRPIYRPAAPAKRRRGRSCRCSFCCCLCWFLLVVILLALVAAAAGGAIYLLYRPQRPSFTVSAVRLVALNLTSSSSAAAAAPATTLTSAVALTLTAKNPNKKVVYVYDDLTLTAATAANGVPLGAATLPGFAHQAGNTTVLAATLAADAVAVDPAAAGSDIKQRASSGSIAVVLDAETRAGVRVGSLRTKKIGIQVRCEGIKVTPPKKQPAVVTKKLAKAKGKNATALLAPAPAPATDADAETATTGTSVSSTAVHSCTVRVRVKFLRWTF